MGITVKTTVRAYNDAEISKIVRAICKARREQNYELYAALKTTWWEMAQKMTPADLEAAYLVAETHGYASI